MNTFRSVSLKRILPVENVLKRVWTDPEYFDTKKKEKNACKAFAFLIQ